MNLKPGPNRKDRINVKNTRGLAFCGLGAFVGKERTLTSPRLYGDIGHGRYPRNPG